MRSARACRTQGTLRRVIIDLDSAIARVTDECHPKLQGIANALKPRAFLRQTRERFLQLAIQADQ